MLCVGVECQEIAKEDHKLCKGRSQVVGVQVNTKGVVGCQVNIQEYLVLSKWSTMKNNMRYKHRSHSVIVLRRAMEQKDENLLKHQTWPSSLFTYHPTPTKAMAFSYVYLTSILNLGMAIFSVYLTPYSNKSHDLLVCYVSPTTPMV